MFSKAGFIKFFALLLLILLIRDAAAQSQGTFPDKGYLTFRTRVHQTHETRFEFSKNVTEKWANEGQDLTNARKLRALVELLIYRKFSVEFLLIARSRMRHMAVGLGMELPKTEFMNDAFVRALELAFPKEVFSEMNRLMIDPLKSPAIVKPKFTESALKGFWRNLVFESAKIVQLEAIRAHHEMQKEIDLSMIGTDIDLGEQWRAACDIHAHEINASKPIAENHPRHHQNKIASIMLSSIQGTDYVGERLLYTPVNYMENFSAATGGRSDIILADINGIRKHPTHQGTLANVIVALALWDLQQRRITSDGYMEGFTEAHWRPKSKDYPRSQLLCKDWSKIPFEKTSDRLYEPNGPIQRAFEFALRQAIRINEEALFYLCQLSPRAPLQSLKQAVYGTRSARDTDNLDVEPEPEDPQDMLDRFIDLVPIFWKSPKLMELVRKTYPLGDFENEKLFNSLMMIAKDKEYRMKKRNERITMYTFVTIGGMVATAAVFSPLLTTLMVISDAIIVANLVWTDRAYRYEMAMITHALFLNVEKEFLFNITPENLREVAILDRESYKNYFISMATLGLATVWIGGSFVFSKLLFATKGVTSTGYLAVEVDSAYKYQREIMKIVKMLERDIPPAALDDAGKVIADEWSDFRKIIPALKIKGADGLDVWNELWLKVLRYVPNENIDTVFPQVYNRLKRRGITLNLSENELSQKLREMSLDPYVRNSGVQARIKTLWEIARELDLIDDTLDTSSYFSALQKAGQAKRGTKLESMLNEILVPLDSYGEVVKHKMNTAMISDANLTVQRALEKELKHIRNIQTFTYKMGLEIDKIKFDDTLSKSVLRAITFLKWTAKWDKAGNLYRTLQEWLRKPVSGKLIPWEALADRAGIAAIWERIPVPVREFLASRPEVISRTFRGETNFTKPLDEKVYQWAKSAPNWKINRIFPRSMQPFKHPIYIDKQTVTKFWHQGVVLGPWVLLFGDRIGVGLNTLEEKRKQGESWGPALREGTNAMFSGDGWQTLINISSGVPSLAISIPISTMNITLRQRAAYTLTAQWFSQIMVTFPLNALKLKMQGTPWGDLIDNLFDPDCLLTIANRVHFYPIFGHWSTLRGRAFWMFRNVIESKNVVGHTGRVAGTIFVVSIFDKALGGATVWRKVSEEPFGLEVMATGKCVKIGDPYEKVDMGLDEKDFLSFVEGARYEPRRDKLSILLEDGNDETYLTAAIAQEAAKRNGFLTEPLTDDEIEAINTENSPMFWEFLEEAYRIAAINE